MFYSTVYQREDLHQAFKTLVLKDIRLEHVVRPKDHQEIEVFVDDDGKQKVLADPDRRLDPRGLLIL